MKDRARKEIFNQLREKILMMEGFKTGTLDTSEPKVELGEINQAFPRGVFPIGVIHELLSPTAACATAANGFISSILSVLMQQGAQCLWISTKRSLFPAALKGFGVQPHQVIFIDLKQDKEVLWAMEQGLKCDAFAAVVAELSEVSFAESQRLQLAVEKSRVTGFLHRRKPKRQHVLACVSRWKVRPLSSQSVDELPGVGHPVWEITLEKIRNGKPGQWNVSWQQGKLTSLPNQPATEKTLFKLTAYG